MTFPTISTLLTEIFNTSGTTHDVTMPGSVTAGDLLLIFYNHDSTSATTAPVGWTTEYDDRDTGTAGSDRQSLHVKVAAGTEGGTTVTLTSTVGHKAVAQTYQIAAGTWSGTLAGLAFAYATGNDINPDPPLLTPSWGGNDTLWIATAGANGANTPSGSPTNYTDVTTTNTSAGSATGISTARRFLAAVSENPGAWTNTSDPWIAATVAVSPVLVVVPTRNRRIIPQAVQRSVTR